MRNYQFRQLVTKRYHLNCSQDYLSKEIISNIDFFNNVRIKDRYSVYKILDLPYPIYSKQYQVL
jgi:hypothetical protein